MKNELTTTPGRLQSAEMQAMCKPMVESGFFGINNLAAGLTLMYMAEAEGSHPATAFMEYHVIKGRPALKADAMLARFQKAGGLVEWEEMTDTMVSAYFSHPKSCPKPMRVDWTWERAKKAKLTDSQTWQKYPRQMLKARVISEGVRMTFPGVTVGVYTPEETEEFDAVPSGDKVDRIAKTLKSRRLVDNEKSFIGRAATANSKVVDSVVIEADDSQLNPLEETYEGDLPSVVELLKKIRESENGADLPQGSVDNVLERIRNAKGIRGIKKIITTQLKSYKFSAADCNVIQQERDKHIALFQDKEEDEASLQTEEVFSEEI